jgi:hypothetical protein
VAHTALAIFLAIPICPSLHFSPLASVICYPLASCHFQIILHA